MSTSGNLEKIFDLRGKVILLTGAIGGIGSELARGLAGVGARMALADVDPARLTALAAEIAADGGEARWFPLDLLQRSSIAACVTDVVSAYGRIDVLVNGAGINRREGFLDVEEETYDRIMGVNLKGTFLLTQEVAKHMVRAGKGSIINFASHNAVQMLGGCAVYGASKSGIAALTRSMAVEWAKHGIRANAIAPGHILTPLTQVTWDHPERSRYLRERIAMGRPGRPDELLGLTILLCSDASSYMSGMMVHVDGGCLAGGQPWPYDTRY
jgi:NAD(P)-dependent dehydrogenase (short-subunit alcohol dehydrogenase family)